MNFVCCHCQKSAIDGTEIFKIYGRWICRDHLKDDVVGVRKHFELERAAKGKLGRRIKWPK